MDKRLKWALMLSAAAVPGWAAAQTAPVDLASGARIADPLDTIVVTASPGQRSRLDTPASVTSIQASQIEDFHPSSLSELFRLIPGIQTSGTTGPGGNANIAVRGLPVATGGAPFIQIQEDGLPTVLYGDILFGNNDYWTRWGPNDARVEAIRGGTASTLASQAPGAVINFISRTGDPGTALTGRAEIEEGLDHDTSRGNLQLSGRIGDHSWFNLGGFADIGHGDRHAPYDVSRSWQLKANVTREFADGNGYLRLYVKLADTREPDYNASLGVGTITGGNGPGGHVSDLGPAPGFDGRDQAGPYSLYNRSFTYVAGDGSTRTADTDGISTQARAVQLQWHDKLSDGLTIDDNARWTGMSGDFTTPFYGATPTANMIGRSLYPGGPAIAALRYANGPQAGQLYTAAYLNTNVDVTTHMRDVGSLVNDFRLGTAWKSGDWHADFHAGWFWMRQAIAMDWHPDRTMASADGADPAMVNAYDAAGNLLTANGIGGYNTGFGRCCARDYDYRFTDSAPWFDATIGRGKVELDASIRQDFNHGSGSGRTTGGTMHFTPVTQLDPATGALVTTQIPTYLADGAIERMDYGVGTTSWTAGALWRLSGDGALFARLAQGNRFNADRMMLSGYFNADGSLNATSGAAAVVDRVRQAEIGLRQRGGLAGGHYTVELTLFRSNFNVTTFEISQTLCGSSTSGCVVADRYRTTGAELYATYSRGPMSLAINATYNQSRMEVAEDSSFGRAAKIPELTYTVLASWQVARPLALALDVTGQTATIDGNGLEYPGSALLGAALRLALPAHFTLSLHATNLLNSYALQGPGISVVDRVTSSSPTRAAINLATAEGRAATASLGWTF